MLSLARRAVLIQASSAVIPSYVMQCAALPGRVLDGIDRVNRNFLWGTTENQRKVHWVGWQKVTRAKEDGGVGLQTARGRNIALLAKLNWRLHTEQDMLWARVLKQRYCFGRRARALNANRLPCSQVWSAMKRGREVFNKGSMWLVGRDNNQSFWFGNWIKRGSIRHRILGPLTREAELLEVKDVLTDSGWDWGLLPFALPMDIKNLILATPVPITSRGSNRLVWAGSTKGGFDVKSAYNLAEHPNYILALCTGWI